MGASKIDEPKEGFICWVSHTTGRQFLNDYEDFSTNHERPISFHTDDLVLLDVFGPFYQELYSTTIYENESALVIYGGAYLRASVPFLVETKHLFIS